MLSVNEDHCRQVNVPNFGEHNLFKDPLIFNKNIVYIISKQYCSINVKTAEEAYYLYLCICLFRQRTQFTMLNTSSWPRVPGVGSPASRSWCSMTSTRSPGRSPRASTSALSLLPNIVEQKYLVIIFLRFILWTEV